MQRKMEDLRDLLLFSLSTSDCILILFVVILYIIHNVAQLPVDFTYLINIANALIGILCAKLKFQSQLFLILLFLGNSTNYLSIKFNSVIIIISFSGSSDLLL